MFESRTWFRAIYKHFDSDVLRELEGIASFLLENEEHTLVNILGDAEYYVVTQGIKRLVLDFWNTIVYQFDGDQKESKYMPKL